jgi:hypothetical protein
VKERDVTHGSCEEEDRQAEAREGEKDGSTEDHEEEGHAEEEEVALTAQRSVLKRRWLVQTGQRPSSVWGRNRRGRAAA